MLDSIFILPEQFRCCIQVQRDEVCVRVILALRAQPMLDVPVSL